MWKGPVFKVAFFVAPILTRSMKTFSPISFLSLARRELQQLRYDPFGTLIDGSGLLK